MRTTGKAAIIAASILMLTGCVGDDSSPTPTPSLSTSGVVIPGSEHITPAPTGYPDADSGETITPQPVPTWDAASEASALTAAEAVMTAYARPDLSFDDWWADVQPLLDDQATRDYAYMDPARIPANQITGPAVLTDTTSAYVAFVDVPTNIGTYRVILSRTDAASPWLTSRFIVPDGVN